jgi:hypothetical protein
MENQKEIIKQIFEEFAKKYYNTINEWNEKEWLEHDKHNTMYEDKLIDDEEYIALENIADEKITKKYEKEIEKLENDLVNKLKNLGYNIKFNSKIKTQLKKDKYGWSYKIITYTHKVYKKSKSYLVNIKVKVDGIDYEEYKLLSVKIR